KACCSNEGDDCILDHLSVPFVLNTLQMRTQGEFNKCHSSNIPFLKSALWARRFPTCNQELRREPSFLRGTDERPSDPVWNPGAPSPIVHQRRSVTCKSALKFSTRSALPTMSD